MAQQDQIVIEQSAATRRGRKKGNISHKVKERLRLLKGYVDQGLTFVEIQAVLQLSYHQATLLYNLAGLAVSDGGERSMRRLIAKRVAVITATGSRKP